jgi:EAL domain-containing protein (putative c-di-GMP-specific phosphodiesterase class I)
MRIVAFEALARFPGDPAHTPDRWFADAWRVGLGIPLELQAAKLATAAFARLGGKMTLFVNASPPVVAAPGFLQSIGGTGGQVTVEVTEHLQVDDYDQLGLELAAFRAAGGQLAIDDFGAGFASFRHILELRPQWIKLDGALIGQLEESEFARGLAHAVVSFALDSGVEVIAEGIEIESELDQVRELGISHGQGFLLSEPLSLEEALALAES